MTDLRKAAEMTQPEALRLADMLENNYPLEPEAEEAAAGLRRLHEENEQLRQELSQPEQGRAAWQDPQYKTLIEPHKAHPDWIPLYTAPPKREWVGLTDEEVESWRGNYDFFDSALVREVEAKLKEKNT